MFWSCNFAREFGLPVPQSVQKLTVFKPFRIREVHSFEMRLHEVGSLEMRIHEVGSLEMRSPKVGCSFEMRSPKVGSFEMRSPKAGSSQVSVSQVKARFSVLLTLTVLVTAALNHSQNSGDVRGWLL
jgi:hypothetical protein